MISYEPAAFEKLISLILDEDEDARRWLVDNGFRELTEFWDAYDGVEKSFSWLLENNHRTLAATIDAMFGNDKAKVWLIQNGCREMAAFVSACEGNQGAVQYLAKAGEKGWLLVAKAIFQKEKKKEKNFFWNLFSFGNPFR